MAEQLTNVFQPLVNLIILFTHKYDTFVVVGLVLFINCKKNRKTFYKVDKKKMGKLLFVYFKI